jgi:predicted nucleic acid binding AN1-type Zn finger protein
MNRMIAMCGLVCDDCIAFIATQKDDDEMRQKVVEEWSTEDERLKLEDVDCDGCTTGKRLHSFCAICDVRMCGLERGVENCAYCNEFPCDKLEKLWGSFQTVSGEKAKANLEEIRKSRC